MIDNELMSQKKAAFNARTKQYRKQGYDRFLAVDFVVGSAGPLSGPALDIGTGKGLTAMALARRKLDVISVDTNSDEQALAAMLAVEAGLIERIRFVHGDASSLNFPDRHFGCAVLMDVLHHLKEPIPVLEEIKRVLRPSGILILADFDAKGFELIASIHQQDGREHAVSGATLESTQSFLCRNGFTIKLRQSGHYHEIIILER